jgi:hypothetical protein
MLVDTHPYTLVFRGNLEPHLIPAVLVRRVLLLLLLLLDRGLLCKALNMAGQCMDAGNTDYKKGTGGEKWVV